MSTSYFSHQMMSSECHTSALSTHLFSYAHSLTISLERRELSPWHVNPCN